MKDKESKTQRWAQESSHRNAETILKPGKNNVEADKSQNNVRVLKTDSMITDNDGKTTYATIFATLEKANTLARLRGEKEKDTYCGPLIRLQKKSEGTEQEIKRVRLVNKIVIKQVRQKLKDKPLEGVPEWAKVVDGKSFEWNHTDRKSKDSEFVTQKLKDEAGRAHTQTLTKMKDSRKKETSRQACHKLGESIEIQTKEIRQNNSKMKTMGKSK